MNKAFKNKKGSSLVLIIIVMAVLSILGAALLQVSLAENNFAIHEEKRLKAYYIARAGAEAASTWIEDPTHTLSTIDTLISSNTTNVDKWTTFADGRFKISFSGDKYKPTIHSVGEYSGVEQKVNLALEKNYFFDSTVTVTNSLHIDQPNCEVTGSVSRTPTASITGYTSNISVQPPKITNRTFPEPSDPVLLEADPTLSWPPLGFNINSGDGYADRKFDAVNLGSDTYYINLSGDMKIQFNSLSGNNANIYVTGNGTLSLYTNSIYFKGNLFTGPNAKTILNIFNSGTLDFQTGNSEFQGFIYGPGADMTIKANMDSVGAIVAKNLTLESGGDVAASAAVGNLYPEDLGFQSEGYSRDLWGD
ncbi:MAG: hypothetical protein K0R93_1392 [Anaerosolibacter sp.]|uniref:pilus assembly PilX N-terminal domain-containing protein n=1 Tax=Anaerosolibacter sp. TaxID=1872527 RepID=UPI002602DC44|nr:pilus assembly PilX N-terminal domain-containing protein [Anaerosolibacter sp.]MDF2546494.1 hypothetical protein [Anaerosolibacter sp.]